MFKVLSVTLCVVMLCAVLCGCGNNNVSDMASEAMSEVVTGTDGEVTDGDGIIGDETQNSTDDGAMNDNGNTNNSNGTGGSANSGSTDGSNGAGGSGNSGSVGGSNGSGGSNNSNGTSSNMGEDATEPMM